MTDRGAVTWFSVLQAASKAGDRELAAMARRELDNLGFRVSVKKRGLGDELGLSCRASNGLAAMQIGTIRKLLDTTAHDLIDARKGIGITALNEIRDKLRERGLKLKGE